MLNSSKPEYLSKTIAAARLGLSVRRLMELAQQGKIEGFRQFDPATRRDATMFDVSDVARLKAEWTPKAIVPAIAAPTPSTALVRTNRRYARSETASDSGYPQNGGLSAPAAAPVLRPWLTIDEAADYSGLPAATLRQFVESGRLAALDVGVRPGGRYRVRRADLDQLEAGQVQSPEDKRSNQLQATTPPAHRNAFVRTRAK